MAGQKSIAHERRVVGYLTPKLHPVVIGYMLVEEIKLSELINEALAKYFKDTSYEKLAKYRVAAKQLEIEKAGN